MDFRDSPEDAAFRADARAALESAVAALPGPEPATVEERAPYWRQFQRAIHQAGYAGLSWPREYGGRAATLTEQAIFLRKDYAITGTTRAEMKHNKAKLYELGGVMEGLVHKWNPKK